MGENIDDLTNRLITAIGVNMNPNVSQQERGEAYKICEEFKANSPQCAQCGLHLCKKSNIPVVRHFGLQLLEHCIKFRWNGMRVEEKAFIKNNILDEIAYGTQGILNEQSHIKGALARIVVEMIKREWPQQWPLLLEELHTLCTMGETQTELVLLIFLGIAEDTMILQTVPHQRRREICKTLSKDLNEIFPFFLNTLKTHHRIYAEAVSKEDVKRQQIHGRLVETVLITLGSGYLEWCHLMHIATENYVLLPLMCSFLADERLRLPTAECLIALLSRKVKPDEGAAFLLLFNERNLDAICSVANSLISQSGIPQEIPYVFLKRLCLVHTGLGNQIAVQWGEIDSWVVPPTFLQYVKTLLAYTKHPSKTLSGLTCTTWLTFFQHPLISCDEVMQNCIPHLLEACMIKLAKFGYPSRNDSPSCDYSRLDFDNDEDFHLYMSKYRLEISDIVKAVTVQNPVLAFGYSARWLQTQLTKPIDLGQDGGEVGLCTYNSPSYLEWDALAIFLESIHSKLFQAGDKPKPSSVEGVTLLKALLDYQTEDPMILSSVLSCISGLFVFLSSGADCLPAILKKIFSVVVYTIPGQTKATRAKTVKNVRRHACSSLIKICKNYPGMLLPVFDEIYNHVKQLSVDPDQLSQLEKCTLYEVLALISNEYQEYERQAKFLQEIMAPNQEMWQGLKQCFLSVEQFMSAIGLDSPPVMPSTDDYRGITRSQITMSVNFLLGIIKRSQWPADVDICRSKGFLVDIPGFGESYRNPLTPSVFPSLEPLFRLISILNRICTLESRSRLHPEFHNALGMTDMDRSNVLGSTSPSADISPENAKQPAERMRNFFATIFDQCFHILGNAGSSLGVEFYNYPNLADAILNSVFDHLEYQSDFRLRTILRVFIKPFIQHCPHQLTRTTVVPLLGALCPLMLKRLSEKWKTFTQRYGFSADYEDEMTESQEILEDKLNRNLTREYLDLLGTTLSSLKRPIVPEIDSMDDDMGTGSSSSYDKLSELGLQLISKENLCGTLIATLFSALHWDSVASVKSAHLCWPALKQLVADDLVQNKDEAIYLLQSVLHGLQVFGQHDANRAILIQVGVQLYEVLRPKFQDLGESFKQIPGCTSENIRNFNEKLFNVEHPLSSKSKRNYFRSLVRGIIGTHVSQQFKEEIEIKNLAPIMFRKKYPNNMDTETRDLGLCNLFTE